MSDRDHDLFQGLRVPRPGDDLGRRVLRAAREALGDDEPAGVWERLAASRGLRVAWGAATAVLLVGHFVLTVVPGPQTRRSESLRARWSGTEELGEARWLPPSDLTARAEALALGATPSPGSEAPASPPDEDNGRSSS